MSFKVECPGCGSYSSSIASAFRDYEPCPQCGLSAQAANEIQKIRTSRASDSIKATAEEATKRADIAETKAMKLEMQLQAIRDVIVEADMEQR